MPREHPLVRASLGDVAAAAGVSISTASRALLDQVGVAERTKRRVHEAATRLGYIKDVRAQALRSRRAPAVGVYVRSVRLSYYGELITALQTELFSHGLEATVASSGGDDAAGIRAFEGLAGTQPLGLIVASGRLDSQLIAQYARVTPLVVVGQSSMSAEFGSVNDDGSGAEQLAQLLYDQGHRRVGAFSFPPERSGSFEFRRQRIRDALAERSMQQIEIPLDPVHDRPNPNALRAATGKVTAIMCINDPSLLATWEMLRADGFDVPVDISLTGYDGVGMLSSPVLGLTSWRQPTEEIARVAVVRLLSTITDGAPPTHERLRGSLLPGRTVGPPRKGRPTAQRTG